MRRNNALPVHLPAALAMPFGAPGRADALLFRPPTITAPTCPYSAKPGARRCKKAVRQPWPMTTTCSRASRMPTIRTL